MAKYGNRKPRTDAISEFEFGPADYLTGMPGTSQTNSFITGGGENSSGWASGFGGWPNLVMMGLNWWDRAFRTDPYNREQDEQFRQEQEATAEGVRTDITQTAQEAIQGTDFVPGELPSVAEMQRQILDENPQLVSDLRSQLTRERSGMSSEAIDRAVTARLPTILRELVRERQQQWIAAHGYDPETGKPFVVPGGEDLVRDLDTALTTRGGDLRASGTKLGGMAQARMDVHTTERERIEAAHAQRLTRARGQMQELITGYQGRLTTGMDLLAGSGVQERRDINRQYDVFGGAVGQDATSRGITGTTIASGLQAGVERIRSDALGGADERLRQQQVDLYGQYSGDTLQAQLANIGMEAGLTGDQISNLVGQMAFGAGLSGDQIGVEERLRTSTANYAGQDAAAMFGAGQYPIGIATDAQRDLTYFETEGYQRLPPTPLQPLFGNLV